MTIQELAKRGGFKEHHDFEDMYQFTKDFPDGSQIEVSNIGLARAGWYVTISKEIEPDLFEITPICEDVTAEVAFASASI